MAGTLYFRFSAPPGRSVSLVVMRVAVSIAGIGAAFYGVQTQLGGITWPWIAGFPGYLVVAYIVRAEGEPPTAYSYDPENERERTISGTLWRIEYMLLPGRFIAESLVGLLLLPFPKSVGAGEVEQPILYGKVCVVPNVAQARFIGTRLRAEGLDVLPVEGTTADKLTRAVDGFAIEVPVDEADHARSWLTDNGYSHFLRLPPLS